MRNPTLVARRVVQGSSSRSSTSTSTFSLVQVLTSASRAYSSLPRSTAPSTEAVKPHSPSRGRVRTKPRSHSQSQPHSHTQSLSQAAGIRSIRTKPQLSSTASPSTPNPMSSVRFRFTAGKGRRRRSLLVSSRAGSAAAAAESGLKKITASASSSPIGNSSSSSFTIPFVRSPSSFQPVYIYPGEAALHLALNPRHMPLPVNLGTKIYSTPNPTINSSTSTASPFPDPFTVPPPPSPVMDLLKRSNNALGDHEAVVSALRHPSHAHHLGEVGTAHQIKKPDADEDDAVLARTLAEAGVRWRLSNETVWEEVLGKLSGVGEKEDAAMENASEIVVKSELASSSSAITPLRQSGQAVKANATQNKGSVDEAVAGLNDLLAKLDMEDKDVVQMDSVKRKRKKKISKHKYQKRRKAQRAQRKRLGK